MSKLLLYVGNWGFHPAPKGISVFTFDTESGTLELKNTIMQDVCAGQLCIDRERGILYVVNECGDRRGEYGGGGEVLAYQIDAEGGLRLMNRRDSLCPEPSYVCLDGTGKYLLVCHCADPGHVTKLVRGADGTLSNKVLFDDAAVVLFRLNEDGSIGEAIDALTWSGTNRLSEKNQVNVDPVTGHIQLVEMISRLHAVLMSPDGKMFVACDKGLDQIYAFQLNRETGKLTETDAYQASWSSFPRYAAFHPTLPVLYTNSEFSGEVNVFRYDSEAGKLKHWTAVSATDREYGLIEGKPVGAQDILVSPDSRSLYVTTCGIHSISMFALDEEGMPELKQVVCSGGNLPRGIALSPDGRFLLSGNMVSRDISTFRVRENGTLEPTGEIYKAVSPSAMQFFETGGPRCETEGRSEFSSGGGR